MEEFMEIRCKRCNKVLTDPEARRRGYGEFCWRAYLNEKQCKNSLFPLSAKRRK